MLVLGIESSCDETSAALVADGRLVLSNVVSSQVAVHAPFGGVVPELASRQHVLAVTHVVRRALEEASAEIEGVDALAVTHGPGLAGALLVGMSFARGLSLARGLPLTPVNHLEGHLHSVWLSREFPLPPAPELPMLALIVSGGHTELVWVEDHGQYRIVGRTLDDAAGEAFDKVGRLLGLAYPGGPAIERAARDATAPVRLPRARLHGTYDFSFSGLKTAVLHAVYEASTGRPLHEVRGVPLPRIDVASELSYEQVANLAAGFQESVVDVLTAKTVAAARELDARSIALVGGVAANIPLRVSLETAFHVPVHVAAMEFSTDNAAMIASAAFYLPRSSDDFDVEPSLSLA